MKKEYQWKDVVVSIGGKEVDFKPIHMDKNDSVFEGDIEILIEDLKSVATQEIIGKTNRITDGVIFRHNNAVNASKKTSTIIIDGVEFTNGESVLMNGNEYLVIAVLEDRIILKMKSYKL